MVQLRPDPSFYPSPQMAAEGPAETLAYVVLLSPGGKRPDALAVVDVDKESSTFGKEVGRVEMATAGDELHHFGWNACSSALCPSAPHPHVERRYLVVPGLRSSRIYIVDTKPDPRQPRIVKTIEPQEVFDKAGYSRPHTVHCGPDGIYLSALGAPDGDGPGGVFVLDHQDFDVKGQWETDRGQQYFAYDFWWHLNHDVMVTSEWGTPNMVEGGLNPELLLDNKYGHSLHFWDLAKRRNVQTVDLGENHQIVLELRPAHDPTKTYGFVGVVVDTTNLESSVWVWHRDQKAGSNGGGWRVQKVITIPPEPADPDVLPPALKPFSAIPPPARSTAGPRWWRSAGTAGASTSRTRCTRRGTSSSTRRASTGGWSSSTSSPRVGSTSTPTSSSSSGTSDRTKSGWRAGTLPPIPIASRTTEDGSDDQGDRPELGRGVWG